MGEGRIGVGVEPEIAGRLEQSAVAKIIKMTWRPDARVKGTHDMNGDTLLAPSANML